MNAGRILRAGCCVLAQLGVVSAAQELPTLKVGESVHATLPATAGARARVRLELPSSGSVVVRVESLDFDARLSAHLPDGKTLTDSSSADGVDPLLVLEASAGGTCELEVVSQDSAAGGFEIRASQEAFAKPQGQAIFLLRRDHQERAARRAADTDRPDLAARRWLDAGNLWYAFDDLDHARTDFGNGTAAAKLGHGEAEVLLELRVMQAVLLARVEPRLELTEGLHALLGEVRAAEAKGQRTYWLAREFMLHDRLGELRAQFVGIPSAADDYARAVEAATAAGRKDMESVFCSKLALAREEGGDHDAADRALDRCEAAAGSAPLLRADALHGRARILQARGDAAAAYPLASEALALEQRPAMIPEILGTLANCCIDLARYEEAEVRLNELESRIDAATRARVEVALHRARAAISFRLRDLAGASAELETALAILDARGEQRERAAILCSLGDVLRADGHPEEALARLNEASERAHSTGEFSTEAKAWQAQGVLHQECGRNARAREAYQRALELGDSEGDRHIAAMANGGLGYVALLENDPGRARSLAQSSFEFLRDSGRKEEALEALDTLARIALVRGDLDEVRARIATSQALLDGSQRVSEEGISCARQRSRFAEWGAIREELASAESQAAGATSRCEIAFDAWKAASLWKGRLALEGLGVLPGAALSSLTRDDLAKRLPADGAILEFCDSLEALHVYVVSSAGIERIDLDRRAIVREDVARYVAALASGVPLSGELEALGRSLYDRLLEPAFLRLPPRVHRLVLVPTPALATLPFDSLPVGEPAQDQLVLDKYTLAYAPSSAFVFEALERPPPLRPERHLLVADAIYGKELLAHSESLASRGPLGSVAALPRLDHSRDEVLLLATNLTLSQPGEDEESGAKLLKLHAQRSGQHSGRCFDLRLGERAEASLMRGDLSSYTDLYLAVHGRVDASDPRRSGLLFSFEEARGGVISLEEIMQLHLDARLVVLAACETARGPAVSGEGVLSLSCGFLHAGARAVVATLWVVDDRDAADFLLEFERARHGLLALEPCAALREAKLKYRRANRGISAESPSRRVAARLWNAYVFTGVPWDDE